MEKELPNLADDEISNLPGQDLLKLTAENLLEEFGAGKPKPGSGSAVAFEGLVCAQLIRTVIDLTNKPGRRSSYQHILTQLLKIDSEIEITIYPALKKLFQEDYEQFGKAIKSRKARNEETDPIRKNELALQATEELKRATDIPIEIATFCAQLADYAAVIFDEGFQSARGDSCVALNDAVSAIAGSLSIVDLNLLSFGSDEWTEKIRTQADLLRLRYEELAAKASERRAVLKEEADRHKTFHLAIKEFRIGKWQRVRMSYTEIEDVARQLQNMMWSYKDKIWKNDPPEYLVQVLRPDIALTKILGYGFDEFDTLGKYELNGTMVETAGLIDKNEKLVSISKRFPREVQAFTAAHELGHALLHDVATSHRDMALDGSSIMANLPAIELEANKFSAFFLMPKKPLIELFQRNFQAERFIVNEDTATKLGKAFASDLRQDPDQFYRALASAEAYDVQAFSSLAKVFRVSVGAMANRLKELGLVVF